MEILRALLCIGTCIDMYEDAPSWYPDLNILCVGTIRTCLSYLQINVFEMTNHTTANARQENCVDRDSEVNWKIDHSDSV